MPFHAHVAPMPRCAVALRSRFQSGMVVAWHGRGMGMARVNQTRPHCVNQMEKTKSKPLAERHGMCELALTGIENGSTEPKVLEGRVLFA
jgi:hypothetical protein